MLRKDRHILALAAVMPPLPAPEIRWIARWLRPIRMWRYTVGAAAGLADLTGQCGLKLRLLSTVLYTGDTIDGFDFTSDMYLLSPKWLWRRWRRR